MRSVGRILGLAAAIALCAGERCASATSPCECGPAARAERVIADQQNGRCWILMRDPQHPGGPGRLVERSQERSTKQAAGRSDPGAALPVIRAGDRVVLEQNSDVLHARFDAVALAPARPGGIVRLRLMLGGRVVRAVVAGPGRAVMAERMEVRR